MLSEAKFHILEGKKQISKIQKQFESILKSHSIFDKKIKVGMPGGSNTIHAYWLKNYGFWWGYWDRVTDHMNIFGVGEPEWESSGGINMDCQVNIQKSPDNWCYSGAFVKRNGITYLAHSGRLGGSRGGTIKIFRKKLSKQFRWYDVVGTNTNKELVIIGNIDENNFLDKLSFFIRECLRIKEGKPPSLANKKLNSRNKSMNNPISRKNDDEFDSDEDGYTKKIKTTTKSENDKWLRHYEEKPTQNIKSTQSNSYSRNPELSAHMKKKHSHTCQLCNKQTFLGKTGNFYTESHHVIPRSKKGSDMPYNILILCPTCHKIFDKGITDVLINAYRKIKRNHLFSDFEGLLKAKEITKSMYQKILK